MKSLTNSVIEHIFLQTAVGDLGQVIVIDGIDHLSDGWCIRCHDQHGTLPAIQLTNSDNHNTIRQAIEQEACRLYAIARLRDDVSRKVLGCRFLPPTITDGGAVAGISCGKHTILAEGVNFLAAYHALQSMVQ